MRNPFSTICGSLDPEISLRLRPACLRNCVALYARRTFLVNSFDRHSSDKSDNHGAEKGSEETCEGNPSCTREESSLWGTGHGKADVSEPVKRKREKVETTDGSNPVNGRKHALSARGVLRKGGVLTYFHHCLHRYTFSKEQTMRCGGVLSEKKGGNIEGLSQPAPVYSFLSSPE